MIITKSKLTQIIKETLAYVMGEAEDSLTQFPAEVARLAEAAVTLKKSTAQALDDYTGYKNSPLMGDNAAAYKVLQSAMTPYIATLTDLLAKAQALPKEHAGSFNAEDERGKQALHMLQQIARVLGEMKQAAEIVLKASSAGSVVKAGLLWCGAHEAAVGNPKQGVYFDAIKRKVNTPEYHMKDQVLMDMVARFGKLVAGAAGAEQAEQPAAEV
tara:strand:- start:82 stop:723 length:642 start_codon:yes stop_codon:yes gene_type:complete